MIRGGEVVDGSGVPRRRADVAIDRGRIVQIGEVDEAAREVIKADGLIVAPGFVDTHTHLDVQLLWDPAATPSTLHGVTTVIGGNCGFSVAPLDDAAACYLLPMLARVEGMPLDALNAAPAWTWRTFGDYLARFEGRIAVNAGFLVGHSALRRVVMGDRAVGGVASQSDISAMASLLATAVDQGGLGFSSSLAATHHDFAGDPVPSRSATPGELVALSAVLADRPNTFLALNPGITPFDEAHINLMIDMATAAGKPLTWNALPVEAHRPDVVASARELARRAAQQGQRVVAQVIPDPRLFYLSFANGFLLDSLPGWTKLFAEPPAERLRRLRDPAARRQLHQGAAHPPEVLRRFFGWETMTLVDPTEPAHTNLAGLTLGEIAARWQRDDPIDVFFDLVVANGVTTSFTPRPSGDDAASWALRAELWREPDMLIGAADAGAHLDNASSFTYTTSLLGRAVRERQLLSLEEAVRALTSVPADLCGVRGRGRLVAGAAADVVVFDAATIAPGPVVVRADLPGRARRLYADAVGIEAVLVNGRTIVTGNEWSGAMPGTVLRSLP